MKKGGVMQVQFISSVAVITPDPRVSRRLYVDAMRLPLIEEADHYQHTENLERSRSFGAGRRMSFKRVWEDALPAARPESALATHSMSWA
ncbi:hypothetical protein OG558_35645 [Kribbella sp. NBC_01510]|uniref:hypothetical protein n=1 Tax=Kribbella sp. NBC_01510 TaxID=2903581 RepID=UPI0038699949